MVVSQARRWLLLVALASGCVDLTRPVELTTDGPQTHPDAAPDAGIPDAPATDSTPVEAGGPDLDVSDVTDVDGPPAVDTMAADGPSPDLAAPDATPDTTPVDMHPVDVAPPVDLPPDLPPANMRPTVAVAAAASPAPVTGTMTVLSVLGADDQGEGGLTYTWATTGTPPGVVGFSINAMNAAKNTTAIFTAAGSYTFLVTIQDAAGLAVTSSVVVQVDQSINDLAVSPSMAMVTGGGTQLFTAKLFDQFGTPLSTPGTVTWSLSGSCGTVSQGGLFTAGLGANASCTLTARSGAVSDTASISVGAAAPVVLTPIADSYVEQGNQDKNFGSATSLLVKTQSGSDNNRYIYLKFSLAGLAGAPSAATLRLYGRSDSSTTMDAVVAVSDTTWGEGTLTWRNKPATGAHQSSIAVTTTAKYREWDVSSYLRSQLIAGFQQITLAITMDSSTPNPPDSFNAREAGSNQPQLVVTP